MFGVRSLPYHPRTPDKDSTSMACTRRSRFIRVFHQGALSRISVSLRVSGFERSAIVVDDAACHATFSLPYLRIGKEKLDQKKCPRVAGLFLVKLFGGVTKWSREKGLAHPPRRLCRSPLPAFD